MKKLKKLLRVGVLAASMGLAGHAHAGIPTIDVANLVSSLQQVFAWIEQYEQMMQQIEGVRQQVSQAERTYNSLSGIRNMGDLVNNPALRSYLPSDWNQTLSVLSRPGGFDNLSSSVTAIRDAARITGLDTSGLNANSAAGRSFVSSQNQAAMNRALGEAAYQAAGERFASIQQLLDKVNDAPEQKDVLDLQARISAETTMVQNEAVKLAAMEQATQAQRDIAYQQAREISMASSKGAMPSGW